MGRGDEAQEHPGAGDVQVRGRTVAPRALAQPSAESRTDDCGARAGTQGKGRVKKLKGKDGELRQYKWRQERKR